tara:strand:- start:104 stop:571 length:468 start_codon:yes stop_codon:yes gene_type:complete
MGRAVNSFTTYVGHAEETLSDHRVSPPEKDLWVAVLCRAVVDACKGPPDLDMSRRANISHKNHYNFNKDQAQHFFLEGGFHFNLICEMAGRDPDYVQGKIRKILLRKNGWNVDVPITSHYRQGPKKRRRGRPKKLTGNSYYAAMGKKGGRPKLYG